MDKQQYAFKDGHFVDMWNIEKYPDAMDANLAWFDEIDGCGSWPEATLELCGCGSPEDVVDAMAEYLTRVEAGLKDWGVDPQVRDGTNYIGDLLLAYLADSKGLTEHGSSIYGVWLDPAGVRWLELYRAT